MDREKGDGMRNRKEIPTRYPDISKIVIFDEKSGKWVEPKFDSVGKQHPSVNVNPAIKPGALMYNGHNLLI